MYKTIELSKFKIWLLIWLLLGKFLIVLEVYALMIQGGYTPANFWGILAIVVPLFAAYITPLVTSLKTNMVIMPEDESEESEKPKVKVSPLVKRSWLWLTLMLIVAYVVWMMVWIAKYSNSFDQQSLKFLQQALLAGESILGVYIGAIIGVVTKVEH